MIHEKIKTATSDERGSIADVLCHAQISHIAVVECKCAGVIRGNHYHKKTTQTIFVSKGSFRYWYQPADKSESVKSILVREYETVTSPPGEVHALEILEPGQFFDFSQGMQGGDDYESDTFRVPSIVPPKTEKA
jgi:dTDP-4-dehydrorhamnose 3,5-epimerase-like enzyme